MNFSESARIGGTLLWYYSICHREVWLMSRGVEPERRHEDIVFGRLIDQNSYAREKHQVEFGNNKFDFMDSSDGNLIVSEIKKSSRAESASRLQLAHYLYELQKEGINAKGVLLYPTEKKRTDVILTDELKEELEEAYKNISQIAASEIPPPPVTSKYCKKCAYGEYCWS